MSVTLQHQNAAEAVNLAGKWADAIVSDNRASRSAIGCAKHAKVLLLQGNYEAAIIRACNSLQLSVGYNHADYLHVYALLNHGA